MNKKTKIAIGIGAFFLIGVIGSNFENTTTTTTATTNDNTAIVETVKSPKEKLKEIVINRIEEEYKYSLSIDDISVNDDLNTDMKDDYIVLIRLNFDTKNTIATGNDVMKLYADDLSNCLSNENVNEVVVFIHDVYNNRDLKFTY